MARLAFLVEIVYSMYMLHRLYITYVCRVTSDISSMTSALMLVAASKQAHYCNFEQNIRVAQLTDVSLHEFPYPVALLLRKCHTIASRLTGLSRSTVTPDLCD